MKKIIKIGLYVICAAFVLYIGIKYIRIYSSFYSLFGKNWQSVIMYHNYKDEMKLSDEEIQKVYDVFDGTKISCKGLAYTDKDGFIWGFYINGKEITAQSDTSFIYGQFEYKISGNPDWIKELWELEEEFAAARGL